MQGAAYHEHSANCKAAAPLPAEYPGSHRRGVAAGGRPAARRGGREGRKMYIGFGINKGVCVPDETALDYVGQHLNQLTPQEQREVVEWFFSGCFVHREEDGEV